MKPVHVQLSHERPEVRVLEEAGQQLASEAVGRGDWRKSRRSARFGSTRSGSDIPKNESPSSLHRMRSSVSGSDTMLFASREGITSGRCCSRWNRLTVREAFGPRSTGSLEASNEATCQQDAYTLPSHPTSELRPRQPRMTRPQDGLRSGSPVQFVEKRRDSPLRRLVGLCWERRGWDRELVR